MWNTVKFSLICKLKSKATSECHPTKPSVFTIPRDGFRHSHTSLSLSASSNQNLRWLFTYLALIIFFYLGFNKNTWNTSNNSFLTLWIPIQRMISKELLKHIQEFTLYPVGRNRLKILSVLYSVGGNPRFLTLRL